MVSNLHIRHSPCRRGGVRLASTHYTATASGNDRLARGNRARPANAYENIDDPSRATSIGKHRQINQTNREGCKTCDNDPYEIITSVSPEVGAGPNYKTL